MFLRLFTQTWARHLFVADFVMQLGNPPRGEGETPYRGSVFITPAVPSLAEIPSGYQFQSLPASFRRHYPYLLQPTAASDADGLAPDVPLPAGDSERMALSPEVKPIHLSPSKIIQPIQTVEEEESLEERVKTEVEMDEIQEGDLCDQGVDSMNMATPVTLPVQDVNACGLLLHHGKALSGAEDEEEPLQDCQPAYQVMACSAELGTPEDAASDAEPCPVHLSYDGGLLSRDNEPPRMGLTPPPEEASLATELPHIISPQRREFPSMPQEEEEPPLETPSYGNEDISCPGPPMDIQPDDPLAGMNVLAAAAELPQACLLQMSDDVAQTAVVNLEVSSTLSPEHTFLQGITLLSEIAELELEKRRQESEGELQVWGYIS